MSLDGDYVVIATDKGIEEFRPNRLSWRDSREFLISGLNRQFRPSRGTLRFRTETEAKQAGSAIIALGRANEQVASQPAEETPVEIRATVLLGPLFLGFVGLFFLLLGQVFLRWVIVGSSV
jgi:hypothetical protein